MTNKNIILFIVLLLIFFNINIMVVVALDCSGANQGKPECTVSLPNPLGEGKTSPQVLIGTIINQVLGVVGSLALLMFIYGGFTWMLAGGNAEAVTKGKNILIWATIGLIVIFSAYALVKFVFGGLGV